MERIPHSEIITWGGFVHIYTQHIADVEIREELMSEYELKRADAFGSKSDRTRYMAANMFLRDVLCRYTHKEPAAIEFAYSDFYNKPLLAGNGIHFNLSYRDEWVLVGVSDKVVGVDIEKHISIENMDVFAKNFFSEKERVWLGNSSPPAIASHEATKFQSERFFRLWTLKEAYIKAMGKGLSYPLQAFSVLVQDIITDGTDVEIILELPEAKEKKWGLKIIQAPEMYSAAVCYLQE